MRLISYLLYGLFHAEKREPFFNIRLRVQDVIRGHVIETRRNGSLTIRQFLSSLRQDLQYRPNVSYHLSSRFSRDASCFSQDESRFSRGESRFSRESLNRLVWNILLARSRCTFCCIRDFRCVVKSVKSKLSTESLFYALSHLNLPRLRRCNA